MSSPSRDRSAAPAGPPRRTNGVRRHLRWPRPLGPRPLAVSVGLHAALLVVLVWLALGRAGEGDARAGPATVAVVESGHEAAFSPLVLESLPPPPARPTPVVPPAEEVPIERAEPEADWLEPLEVVADEIVEAPRPDRALEVPLSIAGRRVKKEKAPAVAASPPPRPASRPERPASAAGTSVKLRLLSGPQFYPPEAQRRRLEGRAVVSMTISPDGVVRRAEILRSSGHPILDEAALASARSHRFAPPGQWRRAERAFTFTLRR